MEGVMSARVTFLVLSGPASGQQYDFDQPIRCIVGRGTDCGLRLDDSRAPPEVSRRHCELILDPPRIQVRDLESLRGTSINGQLIGSREVPSVLGRLFDGDTLGVADCRIRISTSPV